jgi:hypothetical protein
MPEQAPMPALAPSQLVVVLVTPNEHVEKLLLVKSAQLLGF